MNTTVNGLFGPLPAMDIGIPGLVVAKTKANDGTPIWSVTHVASESSVYWFYDPETACKAAAQLAVLCDWTADAETLRKAGVNRLVDVVTRANHGSTRAAHGRASWALRQ